MYGLDPLERKLIDIAAPKMEIDVRGGPGQSGSSTGKSSHLTDSDSIVTPAFHFGLHLNTANALPPRKRYKEKNDNELIHVHAHEA